MKKVWLKVLLAASCVTAFCLGCAACGEAGNGEDPSGNDPNPPAGQVQQVTDYKLDAKSTYTGGIVNGKPEGKGVITYIGTGDKLEAEFTAGKYTYGTLTYANTMKYTGEFKDGEFDGQGTFDWRRYTPDGTIAEEGWLYEGEFKDGTMIGCHGKVTFPDGRREGGEGILWFEGEMNGFPGIKPNQEGTGCIRFGDKSVYTGGVYYNGREYLRYGRGEMMSYMVKGWRGSTAGGPYTDLIYSYDGQFDGVNHGWMWGNGITYFCDADLKPTGWLKGYWDGFTYVKAWEGEFNQELKEEWKNTTEYKWKHEFTRKLEGFIEIHKNTDMSDKTLFIGDSTFEYWSTKDNSVILNCDSTLEADLKELNAINFGIGGSTAQYFDENFSLITSGLKNAPGKAVIQLGYNDVTLGYANDSTIQHLKSIVGKLKAWNPNMKIVWVHLSECEATWGRYPNHKIVNTAMREWTDTEENVGYLDTTECFFDSSKTSGQYYIQEYGVLRSGYHRSLYDGHLNTVGDQAFADFMKAHLPALFGE